MKRRLVARTRVRALLHRVCATTLTGLLAALSWSAIAAAPGNDDFASATQLSAYSGTVSGSTLEATRESGEPDHGGTGSASVWYRWVAPYTGTVIFDTFGSDFDTRLVAYTGNELVALTQSAVSDDALDTLRSRVSFNVTAGTEYRIAVDGFDSSKGHFALSWNTGRPRLASGRGNSFEIGSDGVLRAWGRNENGELGDGSTTQRLAPVVVTLPGTTAVAMAASYRHTIALGANGDVYAWGHNGCGQLGDGTTTQRLAPVRVLLPAGVTAIAIAAAQASGDEGHNLAVGSDGQLYAWGCNAHGQIGNGGTGSVSTPVAVSLASAISPVRIAAGGYHSAVVGENELLYTWGRNSSGQLGNGTTTGRTTPATVALAGGAIPVDLALGGSSSYVVARGGALQAFGWNINNALGDGSITDRLSPVVIALPGALAVDAVSGSGNGAMVRAADGRLYAWGYNQGAVTGTGSTAFAVATPLEVQLPAGITATDAAYGSFNGLARGSDGALYIWGFNSYGQLGDGSTVSRSTPALLPVAQTLYFAPLSDRAVVLPPFAVSATASSGLAVGFASGTPDVCSVAGNTVTALRVGRCSITATQAGSSGFLAASATRSFEVTAALAAGQRHSLEIRADGKLYAWGYNTYGQLGDGSTTNRSAPVQVSLPAGVSALSVAAGRDHGLALGSDGELYGWGDNFNSQLGDGSTTDRTIPVQVSMPAGVSALSAAAGGVHSLALGSDGKLYAWGTNSYGQIGDSSTTNRSTPVQVSLPAGVTALAAAAGTFHSFALGSDGKLYAWGRNDFGQLGDSSITQRVTPVQVSLPAGVSALAVAAGGFHSLALGSDGQLYAWGDNSYGELGDGSFLTRTTPGQVSMPTGVSAVSVAAGGFHGLALGSDGKLYGFGYNTNGQLGDGSTTNRGLPVEVILPAGVSSLSVASGYFHALAMGSDGKLYAWGDNEFGQLGDGSTTDRSIPAPVVLAQSLDFAPLSDRAAVLPPFALSATASSGLAVGFASGTPEVCSVAGNTVTTLRVGRCSITATQAGGGGFQAASATRSFEVTAAVAAGSFHSLEIHADGKLYAWGNNTYGQLGDGSTTSRSTPVQVSLPAGVTALSVSAGNFHNLALGSDGKLYAWGHNPAGQLGDDSTSDRTTPVQVGLPAGLSALSVSAGGSHSLALASDGKLYAWGTNSSGQLGDGSTTNRSIPVQVSLPAGVTALAVSAGDSHSLALASDGKLYAWGSNGSGRLGDGSTTNRTTPVQVSLPAGVTALAVSAGGSHSLALASDGKLYAWGNNYDGQLGDGSSTNRSTPVQVSLPAGESPLAVSAGDAHSVALGSDGKLYAWGSNGSGRLGDGSSFPLTRTTPGQVSLPAGVSALTVSAGGSHTLAPGSDGKLYAWGSNGSGQLGDGISKARTTPGRVSLPTGVSALAAAAGTFHSLALGSDGKLYAWGSNGSGQLGDGSTTDRNTPVQVSLPAGVSALGVSAGYEHSLALGSDGKLYAWGSNYSGQLGDGSTTRRTTPVLVTLPAGVSALAVTAGVAHSLALGSDGKLYAWGANYAGQLGDGSTADRTTPAQVSLPAGASALSVSAGAIHSLALGSDGKLYAWGSNSSGQLGDGNTADRTTPVQVSLPAGISPLAVSAGNYHSMVLGSDGKLYAWGNNYDGQLGDGSSTNRSTPVQVSLPAGVSALPVSAGSFHSLALGSDGKLYAWGRNFAGQLGDGSTTQRTTPVQVGLPAGVSVLAVAADDYHSLALGSDGQVFAWGYNDGDQLGNDEGMSVPTRSTPAPVRNAQVATFDTLIGTTPLDAAPLTVSATASSGLPVRFDSWTRLVCTVSGSTVTLLRTGICVVSADQDGDEDWARADTVTQSFTVTGTAQTISFAPLGNTYLGEASPALVLSASSALPVTLVSNTPSLCTVGGGGLTLLGTGTCQLTASQPGNASFEPAAPVSRSFIISAARSTQSVSFTPLPALAVGTSGALTASASSGLAISFESLTPATCTVSGSTLTAVSTGTCTVSATQPGNASFRPASTVTQSVQIGGSQVGGGGDDGDVPLPGWALAALGAALARGALRGRATTTKRRV